MSEPDSSEKPWSNNPNAPQIPYSLYLAEKTTFAGILISAILYGITVVLFFQCMGALLNSVNHARGSVKWGLIAHTATMFLFVTIYTATTLDILSITYIDNRNFPGINGVLPPGPVGYGLFALSNPIGIVPAVMFLLNNWLADGLLLHRCSVIYAMKYWVIAFPCLIYLASMAMGIVFIHQISQLGGVWTSLAVSTGVPYFSISISLNVLLTLMIVTRLVLHRRNIQRALGAQAGKNGVYTAVVTILVESSALCAITSLLFVVPWGAGSWVAQIFLPALAQTQAIAPFLIVLRVANRSALTSDTIVSGTVGSTHFRSQRESTVGVGTHRDGSTTSSVNVYGHVPCEIGVEVQTKIQLHRNKVV